MDNRNSYPELGLFIYNIIKASGLKKERIAEELDVDLRTVDYYCSGQRRPNQIKLLKLLRVTNTNAQEIPF